MKLHSDTLTTAEIHKALQAAKDAGKITQDVEFVIFSEAGSRTRRAGWDIQLGTEDKTSGPTNSRRYKNSGQYGRGNVWAATWDEWGWFIVALLDHDPDLIFGDYKGERDFHVKTNFKFSDGLDG